MTTLAKYTISLASPRKPVKVSGVMNNEPTDAEFDAAGQQIADLLGLKKNRETGRYDTDWGTKTNKGLVLCVKRILEENKIITKP